VRPVRDADGVETGMFEIPGRRPSRWKRDAGVLSWLDSL